MFGELNLFKQRIGSAPVSSWRHRFLATWYRGPEHPAKRRLLQWAHRLLRVTEVKAQVAPSVCLRLDPRDYVEREILLKGAYEPITLALVRQLLGPGATFVDVGAHIGQFALHAAAIVGPEGRVLAFEPSPVTAARLRHNVELNDARRVVLHHFALGEKAGVGLLRHPTFHPVHGYNSGGAAITGVDGDEGYLVALLPCALVPSLTDLDRIDVFKLDVEGCELTVLSSLFASGSPRPRHIVLEHLPAAFPAAAFIPDLLRSHGYVLGDVLGSVYEGNLPGELCEGNLWARLNF